MRYRFVIWSYEHKQWWGPSSCGYVDNLDDAGRYNATEAGDIVMNSIMMEEVAMCDLIAEKQGSPKFHPYNGPVK